MMTPIVTDICAEVTTTHEADLLATLINLCDDVAWGRQVNVDALFDMTRQDAGPEQLVRLAEAFGMMLVKVEGREFQSSELIAELSARNEELERVRALLAEQNSQLQQAVTDTYTTDSGDVVGQCPIMRRMLALALSIARHPINTLVLGPTGTGKEVIAKLIHFNSPRRSGPFIGVNCTAIPDSLFESEMFGIEKGVATGVGLRKGLIEGASGGTLFLDELADMSLPHQAKLLRVLEEREVLRVGSSKPVPVDINIIAATNVHLMEAVKAGKFREDLYYRINVAEINLPPLSERGDDVLLLAQNFLHRHAARMKRERLSLSLAVQKLLLGYDWPGNVRELNNEMERAAALTVGNIVELHNVSPRILQRAKDLGLDNMLHAENGVAADCSDFALGVSIEEDAFTSLNLQEMERVLIEQAMKETDGNRSRAAQLLGITREGLRKKLLRYEEGLSK